MADTLGRVSGALGWLRARLGVRVVTSLAAALSVAVVLVLAGAALVLLTDRLLRSSLEDTGKQQAQVVAQRVAANFEDDVKQNAVDATAERGDLVQVVRDKGDDGDIEVLGASNPLWTMKPMASVLPGPGDTEVVPKAWVTHRDGIKQTDPETTEDVMVVAFGTSVKGRDLVVYAAQPLENVHEAVDTVFHLVLIGIPLLVLITGIVTYLAAGRALRPVEAIRARVATTRDPSVRVPVPPARDEVGRLAETMNEMLGRLQAGQAVQRRFVADASHELRSPLATIATGLELLARDSSGPAADRDAVTALRGETARLGRLVDALLLLARADESGLRPRFEDVDLDEVAEAERLRPAGRIVPRFEAAHVRVVGDRGQLAQVVRNLVDNACRHARSMVVVSVRPAGRYAALDVADDGPGVPTDQRARVFERFVRLDDARARADGGAGLGLAIVAEVVAAHGGTVDVVGSPLGGALFRVRLPRPEEQPEPETVVEPTSARRPRPVPSPSIV